MGARSAHDAMEHCTTAPCAAPLVVFDFDATLAACEISGTYAYIYLH